MKGERERVKKVQKKKRIVKGIIKIVREDEVKETFDDDDVKRRGGSSVPHLIFL